MTIEEPAVADLEPLSFDEKIELSPFFLVSLKNFALNIITLSLYRFWGKTEVRRKLWARIRMNGEAFEYTGKGKELFYGFLLALAVLGVPYLAIILIAQFLSIFHLVALLVVVYVALGVLMGAAIFLVFRYLASRTTWAGVRFHAQGSPLKYGLRYLGYVLLSAITLGWYSPAMSMRVSQGLWGGLSFGDQRFQWKEAERPSVYGPFAILWVVIVVGYVTFIVLSAASGFAAMYQTGGAVGYPTSPPLIAIPLGLLWFVAMTCAWCNYRAAVMRRVAASLRLGEARFSMKISGFDYFGLTLVNILILIVSLGILIPLVQARTARFLVRRLKSEGGAPIHAALQAPKGPRTGEGLADAFDIGII